MWSTEDGRCIMTSPLELFHGRKPKRIVRVGADGFPGIILCFCESKEILVISVYKMSVLHIINGEYEDL